MEKDENYYRELLHRWIRYESSPQEAIEIMDYLQRDQSSRVLLQSLREEFPSSLNTPFEVGGEMSERVRSALLSNIEPAPVIRLEKTGFRFNWLRAAVAVILM